MMVFFYGMNYSRIATENIAQEIAKRMDIFPSGGRVLFLKGEMGTGKTTCTRKIGEYFGVPYITSPTFSILQEYAVTTTDTDVENIIHIDLHRADNNRQEEVLETLEEQYSSKNIYIIEWPSEMVIKHFVSLPSITMSLSHSNTSEERSMDIVFQNPASVDIFTAKKYIDTWKTPVHVQRHIEVVRKVSVFCAERLQEFGVPIDIELVESGAVLHDCVRYVDFPDLDDFSRYQEEVTDEKKYLWRTTKEKYKTTHHADAMAEILQQDGFDATAEVVAAHNTAAIYRKKPFSWEEICVYYGDKRALHDSLVTLKERLEDGKKRYAHDHNPYLEEKLYDLENQIFTRAHMSNSSFLLL